MKRTVVKYWRIWKALVGIQLARHADVRLDFVAFFIGKIIRMGIVFVFTMSLFSFAPTIGGFHKSELLLLFAVMNFLDVFVQLIWRGLGHVHEEVNNGALDVTLTKPISSLFWSSFRIFDLYDFTTIPVVIWIFWYALKDSPVSLTGIHVLEGIFLLLISLTIGYAFNVLMASISFWMEASSGYGPWFLYRHLLANARMPGEFFPSVIRTIFTFVIPFFLIVSFPVRALFGKLSFLHMLIALLLAFVWLRLAFLTWRQSVRHYTSASS